MNQEDLKRELDKLLEMENKERSEYKKNGGIIGLDAPISQKYKKLRKELFARYDKQKQR